MYEKKPSTVHSFSHVDLTDDLCYIDHYWEQSVEVKGSAMITICPYSKILKERQEIWTVNTAWFLQKKGRSSTRDFIREVKSLYYTMVKTDQCGGLIVTLTKTSGLCFEHIKVNVQNLIFISFNVVLLLYITFN